MNPADRDEAIARVRGYHEVSKHHVSGYAPGPETLDWEQQPAPFRCFDGAPLQALPLVEGTGWRRYPALFEPPSIPVAPDLARLGLFLELAFGISAWKQYGGERWAVRNTPSSGNLHGTEVYLLLWRGLAEGLAPGLYHYRADGHGLERRALLPPAVADGLCRQQPESWGAIGLSGVDWRETWKYGVRALRYAQLDFGHALAAARFAGAVVGWGVTLDPRPADAQVAAVLGLDRTGDFAEAAPERPGLLALLGQQGALGEVAPWATLAEALEGWCGKADRLAQPMRYWPEQAAVETALVKPACPAMVAAARPAATASSPATEQGADAVRLIRQRRSAQRMDRQTGMGQPGFLRLLQRLLPGTDSVPFDTMAWPAAVDLLLFVHAVEGLEPGLYLLQRSATPPPLAGPPALPAHGLPFYAVSEPADLRALASQVACYQGLGGRGAFSLAMLADLDGVLAAEGGWAYRRLYWECGLIGQLLYLEAEANGLRGCGIGCFFDDAVHALVGLPAGPAGHWQDLYHFSVGGALEDSRLATLPAYERPFSDVLS